MKKKKQKSTFEKIKKLFTRIKFFIRLFILTLIAGFIGLIIILNSTDPTKYKDEISASIESLTGKKVEIEGKLSWELLSFEPGIQIEKITISNEPWASNPHIITAQNIKATLSLKHLLTRKISLDTLVFESPNIYLEISKDGKKNWQIAEEKKEIIKKRQEEKKQNNSKSKFEINIKSIKIRNANIFFEDKIENIKENLRLNDLSIFSDNYNDPIYINGDLIYRENKIHGNLKTKSMKELLEDNNNIPLTGLIKINDSELKFASKLNNLNSKLPSISTTTSVKINNLKTLLKNVDLPNSSVITGDFEIIATPTFISFKKVYIKYKTAVLTGTTEITLQKNKRPNINAKFNIPLFDIPNLFYPQWKPAYFDRLKNNTPYPYTEYAPIKDPKAFRDIPLPVKELDWANVNLHLTIDKLKAMPEMPITNIDLTAILNNGKGIIAPLSLNYMGGKLVLNAIVDNYNNTFNAETSIKIKDVNIGKIIDSTGYKNFFKGGDSDANIVLKGHGPNLATLMTNIHGYIKAYTTNEITGYRIENDIMANDLISSLFRFIGDDIIGTITNKKKKEKETNIQCIAVNLNLKDGVTKSDRNIAMQTSTANIIIDGLADLGKEYIDVSIVTVVKEGFKFSSSLAEMIKIQGALAKPEIIINKDGVINNVATTALTTTVIGTLTGGITLAATGLGLLTKSWIQNIQADKNPCQTALAGTIKSQPKEEFDKQIIMQNEFDKNIQETKKNLNKKNNSNIEKEKQKIKQNY